jgi:hypothetical protein
VTTNPDRDAIHQARRDAAANNIHPHTPRNNKPVTRPKDTQS